MNPKKLLTILGIMVVAAIIVILVLKYAFKVNIIPANNTINNSQKQAGPPATSDIPHSLTANIGTWTGVLNLDKGSTILVGNKNYNLNISGQDTHKVLSVKGYKTGDTINVMGRLNGDVIELVGLNKYIKK